MFNPLLVYKEAVKSPYGDQVGIYTLGCQSLIEEEVDIPLNVITIDLFDRYRITSYNVCYTKLLRHRVNSELQEVFEEKKLIHAHGKKLST